MSSPVKHKWNIIPFSSRVSKLMLMIGFQNLLQKVYYYNGWTCCLVWFILLLSSLSSLFLVLLLTLSEDVPSKLLLLGKSMPRDASAFLSFCSSLGDLDVRLGCDLCQAEQDFLHKRKHMVASALKKILRLDRELHGHEVCGLPYISNTDGEGRLIRLIHIITSTKTYNYNSSNVVWSELSNCSMEGRNLTNTVHSTSYQWR